MNGWILQTSTVIFQTNQALSLGSEKCSLGSRSDTTQLIKPFSAWSHSASYPSFPRTLYPAWQHSKRHMSSPLPGRLFQPVGQSSLQDSAQIFLHNLTGRILLFTSPRVLVHAFIIALRTKCRNYLHVFHYQNIFPNVLVFSPKQDFGVRMKGI